MLNITLPVLLITIFIAGLAAFIDGESVMAWFNAANVTAEHEHTNVILAKKSATEIEVTFTSGKNNGPSIKPPNRQLL